MIRKIEVKPFIMWGVFGGFDFYCYNMLKKHVRNHYNNQTNPKNQPKPKIKPKTNRKK
jgi:hypothetical protein